MAELTELQDAETREAIAVAPALPSIRRSDPEVQAPRAHHPVARRRVVVLHRVLGCGRQLAALRQALVRPVRQQLECSTHVKALRSRSSGRLSGRSGPSPSAACPWPRSCRMVRHRSQRLRHLQPRHLRGPRVPRHRRAVHHVRVAHRRADRPDLGLQAGRDRSCLGQRDEHHAGVPGVAAGHLRRQLLQLAELDREATARPIWPIVLALSILSIPPLTRLVRANTIVYAQREFVLAARSVGASSRRVVFREILPNVVPAMVSFAHGTASSSWPRCARLPRAVGGGADAHVGKDDLRRQGPPPGGVVDLDDALVLFLTILSINLIGDVLAEKFNIRDSIG